MNDADTGIVSNGREGVWCFLYFWFVFEVDGHKKDSKGLRTKIDFDCWFWNRHTIGVTIASRCEALGFRFWMSMAWFVLISMVWNRIIESIIC